MSILIRNLVFDTPLHLSVIMTAFHLLLSFLLWSTIYIWLTFLSCSFGAQDKQQQTWGKSAKEVDQRSMASTGLPRRRRLLSERKPLLQLASMLLKKIKDSKEDDTSAPETQATGNYSRKVNAMASIVTFHVRYFPRNHIIIKIRCRCSLMRSLLLNITFVYHSVKQNKKKSLHFFFFIFFSFSSLLSPPTSSPSVFVPLIGI